jgi:hypothetical protein
MRNDMMTDEYELVIAFTTPITDKLGGEKIPENPDPTQLPEKPRSFV